MSNWLSLLVRAWGLHLLFLIQGTSGLIEFAVNPTTTLSTQHTNSILQQRSIFDRKKQKHTDDEEFLDDPMDQYSTVIDILSQNVMFSKFLLFLQHNDYIDYLNGLDNFTLVVPINSAFYISKEDESDEELQKKRRAFSLDNYLIQDKVIDLNTEFQNSTIDESGLNIIQHGTHYPLIWEKNGAEKFLLYQHPDFTEKQPSEMNSNGPYNHTNVHSVRILTDSIFKPTLQNCTIYAIDSLLPLKFYGLSDFIVDNSQFDLNTTQKLLQNTHYLHWNDFLINNTFIAPSEKLLKSTFTDLELKYLTLDAKFSDMENFLEKDDQQLSVMKKSKSSKKKLDPYKTLIDDQIRYVKNFVFKTLIGGLQSNADVESLNGYTSEIQSVNNGLNIKLNNSISTTKPSIINYLDSSKDLVVEYGAAHVFEEYDLTDVREMVNFNSQKYLMALEAFDFVDELYFRNLDHLITNNDRKLTLFVSVPNPTAYDVHDPAFRVDATAGYSSSILIYHFMEEELVLKEFFDSPREPVDENDLWQVKLFDSMYCNKNKHMGGSCQKLKLLRKLKSHEKIDDCTFYLNNEGTRILNNDPYTIGNTSIYLISEQLTLPSTLSYSVGSYFHCSQSMLYLNELNLLNLPDNNKGYTILLPCYDSWENLQLNLDFIKNNITALNSIMKNFIWDGLMYSDAQEKSGFETYSLNGDKIEVNFEEDTENLVLNVSSVTQSLVTVDRKHDIIFDKGVIHPINNVYYPSSLDITLPNLISVSGTGDFLLFAREFPELDQILKKNLPYSILVPTASSLLYDGDIHINATRLKDILSLHFISTNSTKALLDCEGDIHTLYDEPLSCRKADPNNYFLRVKNGEDHEVRVLKKGCSTRNPNSCVFVIDKPISLKWLTKENYHLHLPYVSFAIGIVIGAIGFTIISLFIMYLLSRKQYDEVEFSDEEIQDETDHHTPYRRSSVNSRSTFGRASNDRTSSGSTRNSDSNINVRTPLLRNSRSGSRSSPKHNTGPPTEYHSIMNQDEHNSKIANGNKFTTAGTFERQYSENSQSRPITMRSTGSISNSQNYLDGIYIF